MSNLSIYPEQLAKLTDAQLAALPAPQLVEVQRNLEHLQTWVKQARAKFDAALLRRLGELERAARMEVGKDFGVVHFADGALEVTADTAKRVVWNQPQLAAIAQRIAASGEKIEDYLDVEFSVPEARFNNWHQGLRSEFEAARTVKPGKTIFKLAVVGVDATVDAETREVQS
jgi:hypothetical protein